MILRRFTVNTGIEISAPATPAPLQSPSPTHSLSPEQNPAPACPARPVQDPSPAHHHIAGRPSFARSKSLASPCRCRRRRTRARRLPSRRLQARSTRDAPRNVQCHRVPTRRRWNRVRKIPPALGVVQLLIVRPIHRRRVRCQLSAFEVFVRTPPVAVVRVVRRLPRQQAHRPHGFPCRDNLNRRNRRLLAPLPANSRCSLPSFPGVRPETPSHPPSARPRVRHHVEVRRAASCHSPAPS